MRKNVIVKQDEENIVTVEILADAIVKISEAMEKLQKTKLTKKALLLLIHDNCGFSGKHPRKKPTQKDIENVMESIATLKKYYVKG